VEKGLVMCEKKILIKIHKIFMWKWLLANKSNEEIHYNFKYPDKITIIKGSRLEWLGHVEGIDGEEAVQMYLTKNRAVGGKDRPRLRWADDGWRTGFGKLGVKSCGRRKSASVVRKT
jgi:hypothetical protein